MYTGYIYKITNTINKKVYIGRTFNLKKRWLQHRKMTEDKVLYKAFHKYGIESFKFEVILTIKSRSKKTLNFLLNVLEIFYIKKYNSFNTGYNCTLGGEGTLGRILSEENRLHLKNSHLGYKHTKEHTEKIRLALKGRNRNHKIIMKGALKRRKPILLYSLDGRFIKEWEGATLIPQVYASAVICCCKGKLNSAQGYIWKYKDSEQFPLSIKVPKTFNIKGKTIYQYTKNGRFIKSYNNIKEASNMTNIKSSSIRNNLSGLSKSSGGYIWSYEQKGGLL